MITTEGKMHIKRMLAGWEAAVGQSLAFGIGTAPADVSNTSLQFETARENVKLTSYDFTADRLVFKARVPEGLSGIIHEVGLYSGKVDSVSWQFGSRVLTTFDSSTEEWIVNGADAQYTTTGSRTGVNSMALSAAANGSQTGSLSGVYLDLSEGSVSDTFSFALNAEDVNASSVTVRFKNDASNYFSFNLSPITQGYQILTALKSEAVVTGAPRWADISSLEVTLNATAGGASVISMDAIRIDGVIQQGQRGVLVAREVLSTPYVKEEGKIQEVEFSLGVVL